VITKTKQQWQQSQAGIQEQKAELQFYNITAPFAGTVGDIPVKVGDFVDKTAKLITITQNQPLEVNLSIPVDRASEVRQGSQIELLNDQNKVIGSSQVFFISPNVNDTTQSVLIKAAFENANNQLRANQFVRARVIWAKRPGILIPATAVSRIAGQEFVFVVESDGQTNSLVAKQKPVKLGTVQGNNYPVLEGLKAGEKIVVSGLLKLANNTPIAPES
jgi:RND family efflux transporter MFP subunit